MRTKERERDEGHQVGGPEPPFSSPIPLFHDWCCPPGERSEGPDRGTRARTRRPTRGRAAPRGCRSATAQGSTHTKKGRGSLAGRVRSQRRGTGAGRFPAAIFSLTQILSAPPTWQLLLDGGSSSRPRPAPQRGIPPAGHRGHSRNTRSLAARLPGAPPPRRPGDAERPAGGGSPGGRDGRGVGSPALTSCSTRGSSAPREKRK